MSQEIDINGISYVSSKRAAQISGYAQDYIGQLCRGGQIQAQRVGGLWYLTLDSLYQYKQKADSYVPTAPRKGVSADLETSVSLDGKDYISASRAAEITGYNQDYVSQLARSGTILSRQIGSRWYVERKAILLHKGEKDRLLGAVQAESVGIHRPGETQNTLQTLKNDSGPHFTYTTDEGDLMPILRGFDKENRAEQEKLQSEDGLHILPIRVVDPVRLTKAEGKDQYVPAGRRRGQKPALSKAILMGSTVVATVVIVLSVGYASLGRKSIYADRLNSQSATVLLTQVFDLTEKVSQKIEAILISEITYRRIEPSFEL